MRLHPAPLRFRLQLFDSLLGGRRIVRVLYLETLLRRHESKRAVRIRLAVLVFGVICPDFLYFTQFYVPSVEIVRQCCGNRTRQARLLCRDTNGGGGAARNDAMRAARGRWLMFADADDYFLPSLGTVLDRYACNETYDAVFFPPIGKGSHKSTADKVAELCMKWKSDPQKYDNRMRYGFVGPWSKMVKRQFAQEQGLYFYSTRKQNDFPLNIMLGKNLKHFTVDETPIYCWDRINTSTSDRYDMQACRDSLWVYAQAIHYILMIWTRSISKESTSIRFANTF